MFKLSNNLSASDGVYQANAGKDTLLATTPFVYEYADGNTADDSVLEDDYVRSAEGTILKAGLVLTAYTGDDKPEFDAPTATAFLESGSNELLSEDIGAQDWVHQSRQTAEELLAQHPLESDVLTADDFVISAEGTILHCGIMLIPTDDTPEFDEDAANAFLAANPPATA